MPQYAIQDTYNAGKTRVKYAVAHLVQQRGV